MNEPIPRVTPANTAGVAPAAAPRVPRGTPTGGQFSTTSRPEGEVLLVEFAADEAEQVDTALRMHQSLPGPAVDAATAAGDQVRAMRAALTPRNPFAAAEFDTHQVAAMHRALEFHRDRAANPRAVAATDAALFRLDTAAPSEEVAP